MGQKNYIRPSINWQPAHPVRTERAHGFFADARSRSNGGPNTRGSFICILIITKHTRDMHRHRVQTKRSLQLLCVRDNFHLYEISAFGKNPKVEFCVFRIRISIIVWRFSAVRTGKLYRGKCAISKCVTLSSRKSYSFNKLFT